MAIQKLNSDHLIAKSIFLGEATDTPQVLQEDGLVIPNITGSGQANQGQVWGSLSWSDNTKIDVDSLLQFSAKGNLSEGIYGVDPEDHDQYLIDNVEGLRLINPALDFEENKVVERYIDLSQLKIKLPKKIKVENLPKLIFKLPLKKDEGALLYLEHNKINKGVKGSPKNGERLMDYIQCKSTEGYETNKDRTLEYEFLPFAPDIFKETKADSDILRVTKNISSLQTVLKILIFKRLEKSNGEIIDMAIERLNQEAERLNNSKENLVFQFFGKKKYKLLVYEPNAQNEFFPFRRKSKDPVELHGRMAEVHQKDQIDPTKKTLFLIHGTFVNTQNSYLDALKVDAEGYPSDYSFINHLINNGLYEQVIAFDHPTISHDAKDNGEWLLEKLKALELSFEKKLDIITTSRGCFIADHIVANSELSERIKLNRVLMFSPAHGVGYFRCASLIPRALSSLSRKMPSLTAKFILALLQLSSDYFLSLPGCRMMAPENLENSTLRSYLDAPLVQNDVKFKNVISDWNKHLVDKENFLKRNGAWVLDKIMMACLGIEHDWVVGCEAQNVVMTQIEALGLKESEQRMASVHGRYLDRTYTKHWKSSKSYNAHEMVKNYFLLDA